MEGQPHIAVVDDNHDICELVGRYLTEHGYCVSTANSAEALKRVLQKSAPDLIALDIMMPGEDGLSVCRKLRADGFAAPPAPVTSRKSQHRFYGTAAILPSITNSPHITLCILVSMPTNLDSYTR
jgi:DNA-binding response OmpR family regulator